MAKMNTYPAVSPAIGDKLLGTDVSDTGVDPNGGAGNFLLSAIWALFRATGGTLSAGFDTLGVNDGSKSAGTYTPEVTGGNSRRITNDGAFTLAAPATSNDCDISVKVTNGATAGAITFSGFAKQDGDTLTLTSGAKFNISIHKADGDVTATVKALQ